MSEPVPAKVEEARAVLARHDVVVRRMLVGIFAAVALILGGAFAEVDAVVISGVVLQVVWLFVHMAQLMGQRQEVTEAMAVTKAWQARGIDQLFDAAAPAEPDDPRWEALGKVLARIRELGDDHARDVAASAEQRLKAWMTDLAGLEEALGTEQALGEGPRTDRLRSAVDARAARIDRVIEGLRDLHVELAVRESSAADPLVDELERLLAVAEADAEVASVGQPAARRAAQARKTLA